MGAGLLQGKKTDFMCSAVFIATAVFMCGCVANEDLLLRHRGLAALQEAETFHFYLAPEVGELLTSIRAGGEAERERASRLLALMGAGCVESAEQLAEDNDWEARREAAWILGTAGSAKGVPILLKLLADENWAVRGAAADALGTVLIELDGTEKHARRDSGAQTDPTERSAGRISVAEVLAALQVACRDEMWPVRLAAVRAAARARNEKMMPLLIEAAFDVNDHVALQALESLASLNDRRALAVFKEVLLGDWRNRPGPQKKDGFLLPLVPRSAKSVLAASKLAILGLERLATKEAVCVLMRVCTRTPSETGLSWRVRGLAAAALERLNAAGLHIEPDLRAPVFAELLQKVVSADIAARTDAETLLAECGAGAAQPVLDALLETTDEEISLRLLHILRRTLAEERRSAQRLTSASALGLLCPRLLSFPPRCQEFIIDWSVDEIGAALSFRTLALAARSSCENVRAKAINYLSLIPVTAGAPQHLDAVGDLLRELLLDPLTAIPAVEAITRRPLPAYREELERMFHTSGSTADRLRILNALASLRYDSFSRFLLDAWAVEHDNSMREYLLFHLAQSGDACVHAVVTHVLRDSSGKHVALQRYALELIEKQKLAVPTDVLADVARNAGDSRVRALALRAYVSSCEPLPPDEAIQFITSFLADADRDVRAEALKALARGPGVSLEMLEDHLRAALDSGLPVLQHAAIEILAGKPDEAALEWLLSFVEDMDAPVDARALVLLELPRVKRPPATTRLIAERLASLLPAEKSERMRSAILTTLGLFGDRVALPAAITACADASPYVRANALHAIAAMRGEPMNETLAFLPLLLTAARDEDANVRAAAIHALAGRRRLFLPMTMRAEGPAAEHIRAAAREAFATLVHALADSNAIVSNFAARTLGALEETRLAPIVAAMTRSRFRKLSSSDSEEKVLFGNARFYHTANQPTVARYEYSNVLRTQPDESVWDELAHESLAVIESQAATAEGLRLAVMHMREAIRLAGHSGTSPAGWFSPEERRFHERLWSAIARILLETRPVRIAAVREEIWRLSREAKNSPEFSRTMAMYLASARVCLGIALELAAYSVEVEKGQPDALAILGWVHYNRSEYEQAEEYLRKALASGVRLRPVRLWFAATLAALGRRVEALEELNAALDADPGLWRDAVRIREFQPVGKDREFADVIGR